MGNNETYPRRFCVDKSLFICPKQAHCLIHIPEMKKGGTSVSLTAVFFVGVGLAMDACAVSFAKGISLKKNVKKYAFLLALAFGLFQGLMPLLGWWVGTHFEALITSVDHWIAFFLLGFIGLNMIRESKEAGAECEACVDSISGKEVLLLAIATSIDALAVGISFAFLQVSILPAVCLIAATTFVISFAAVFLGNRIGGKLGKYAEIAGGVILILIGLKILIEHLFG